jgi:hypothetical protein
VATLVGSGVTRYRTAIIWGALTTLAGSLLSGLLVRFTHADNLYLIRDSRGRRLEDAGEMLLESNPLLDAGSFDREREVRKHVGDYVLFMKGLFPESLRSPQRFRQLRLDVFVDYMKAGKESYKVVSAFDELDTKTAPGTSRERGRKRDSSSTRRR